MYATYSRNSARWYMNVQSKKDSNIAFHTRLRDAIETIVDDDILLVEFLDAKL